MRNKLTDRFEMVHKEGSQLSTPGQRMVVVDKETGVNYLFVVCGYGMGVTPLIGADGKPLVSAPGHYRVEDKYTPYRY
ncbi:MAG: xylan 1,4-beta-xylosidase [Lachnospiraceae bacterium]|nr:xylan 1,4-beta-xylosidase [Lachnospiraceae bacterium]